MALRDRVTVTTKSGQTIEVVATKVGATVGYSTNRDWVEIFAEGNDAHHTRLKEAKVAASEVVAIVRDVQPKPPAKKKG